MHKTKKVTIICYSIAAILLILISIFCFLSATGRITYGSFTINGIFSNMSIGSIERLSGDFIERGSYKISREGLHSLDVQWAAGAVEVIPYDGEDVIVTEYAQRDLSEKEQVSYRTENGCLRIRSTEEYFETKLLRVLSAIPEKKLLVQIPKTLAADMEDISVASNGADILVEGFTGKTCSLESYSGSIDTGNMSFNDFTADTTSGNMNLMEISTDSFTVESYSGKITASGLSADSAVFGTTSGKVIISDTTLSSLSVSTYSGNAELENVTCNALDTDSTSGKLTVSDSMISKSNISTYSGKVLMDGYFDEIKTDSTSGDVSVTSDVCPGKFYVDSYSGNVSLSIPETEGISAEFDSLSGKFDSGGFSVAKSSGDYKLTVNTTSGNFSLKKIG